MSRKEEILQKGVGRGDGVYVTGKLGGVIWGTTVGEGRYRREGRKQANKNTVQ